MTGLAPATGEKAMNHPEATMNNALPKNTLIATEKAISAGADAISLARQVPAPLKAIGDQVIRSASSVPAQPALGWLASQAKVAESELGSDR